MIDFEVIRSLFPIDGKQVKIGIFAEDNITDSYLNWLNDPDVVRFSNQRFIRHTRRTAEDYLQSFFNSNNLFLSLCLKGEDRFVGTMSVYISKENLTADIGILVGDRESWGQGYGGDAWSTLLNALLERTAIRKVTGGTLRCNTSMVQIMINSGMKPDGIRVAQELVNGQVQDILHFAKFQVNKLND